MAIFNGYRMISLPLSNGAFYNTAIQNAVDRCLSELVHCLLRYGALYSHCEDNVKINGLGNRRSNQSHSMYSARLSADVVSIIIQKLRAYGSRMDALNNSQSKNALECPHGIYQLPIPNGMKTYLDLKDNC